MRASLLFLFVCLTACGSGREANQQPVDYEAINLRAEGPARPISPQPFGQSELVGIDPHTCVIPGEGHREVLFVATRSFAAMRLDGENLRFLPIPSEDTLPFDVEDSFIGSGYTIALSVDQASETPAGPDMLFYNGAMTVRDARERLVYEYRGRIECGAGG